MKVDSGDKAEVERLEKQVEHYKEVLAQTEAILTKLQSGVEAEEGVWKQRLADQEAEMSEKCAALEARNASLEQSLSVVGQAEEVREGVALRGAPRSEKSVFIII